MSLLHRSPRESSQQIFEGATSISDSQRKNLQFNEGKWLA